MMKNLLALTLLGAGLFAPAFAGNVEPGFTALMDGKTFSGWKVNTENPGAWKIEDGAFVARGPRSHLFYEGDCKPFKNFHLKLEVMTEPGSNGGICFHTAYQEKGWPKRGFELQVNNSHRNAVRTGSLFGLVEAFHTEATDNRWWTQELIVEGNRVTVLVDGKMVLRYVEPPGAQPGKDYERKLGEGTFALQAHDPKSVIYYRNIRVKRLD